MQSVLCLAKLVVCFILVLSVPSVHGHGLLAEPPSRSSLWRFGFDSPPNYEDNELFCGGFKTQWEDNDGKCGVCGDPYNGERQNEAGGIYANGIISRRYKQGQTITIEVVVTANHLGYFEFRLCPHNNPSTPVSQSCLDEHLLRQKDGSERYNVTTERTGTYSMEFVLPPDVTCSQCVIQWKYNTGNSYGCDESDPRICCVGCGPQEQFYGCADVAINQTNEQTTTPGAGPTTSETKSETASTAKPNSTTVISKDTTATTTTTTTSTSTTLAATTQGSDDDGSPVECTAVGDWTGDPGMRDWCVNNCALGYCPSDTCSESCNRA